MPVGIKTPSNQIKLTNVSLVRMKKGKKRFEIACYKNKVLEWRNGNEKDLDNVLQIPNVFMNVSKGQVASSEDLSKSFGANMSVDDIILEILKKGEFQVGDKERHAQLDRMHAEVIDMVAARLVDPKSKRVYTSGIIEKALDQLSTQSHQTQNQPTSEQPAGESKEEASETKPKPKPKVTWTGVVTTKSAKSQALDAIKALLAHQPIPVARARMRLRITCPTGILKQAIKSTTSNEDGETKVSGNVKERILSLVEQVESQDVVGNDWECVGFFEPGSFKELTEFVGSHTKGKARVEVLDMAVVHEGDN